MKIWARFSAGLILALAAAPAAADDFQLWTGAAVKGPVEENSRFLLWLDGQTRFRNDASDLGVSLIRPGLGWRVNRDLSVWAGYARVVFYRETTPDVKENRLWQQAVYPIGDALGGSISGRTRLEQRLIQGGDETGWRVRQSFRYSRPLPGTPFSAIIASETFIAFNDTDWGAASGYDQSRNFIGVNFKPAKNLTLESGYMLNHLRRNNAPNALNHIMSMSISLAL